MRCQNQRWLKAMVFPVGYSSLGSSLGVEVTSRTLFPMEHVGCGALMGGLCLFGVLIRPEDAVCKGE